jgi:hypothetical protein
MHALHTLYLFAFRKLLYLTQLIKEIICTIKAIKQSRLNIEEFLSFVYPPVNLRFEFAYASVRLTSWLPKLNQIAILKWTYILPNVIQLMPSRRPIRSLNEEHFH